MRNTRSPGPVSAGRAAPPRNTTLAPTHRLRGQTTGQRMTLADHLEAAPRRRTGLPCSVGELLDTLDPIEAQALTAMMGELGWSQERIYEALKAEGHIVGKQTINRHRSRACRCFA